MVFSLLPIKEVLISSTSYRFNNSKANNRCSGLEVLGRAIDMMSQATSHNKGDVPKNRLKSTITKLRLPSTSCPVTLCPASQKVSTDNMDEIYTKITEKKPKSKFLSSALSTIMPIFDN